VSGSIEVGGGSERSDLASVSGKITVENAGGELDAETVSGSIRVDGGLLESASFDSVSGSIHFDADMAGRGEFDFESMSGSVTLIVSPGVSADFDVSTFSGAISNDIGPEAQRSRKYTSEKNQITALHTETSRGAARPRPFLRHQGVSDGLCPGGTCGSVRCHAGSAGMMDVWGFFRAQAAGADRVRV
jgi:hypothetical protein